MGTGNDVSTKHGWILAAIVVAVLVVAGIVTMDPGPDDRGYRDDGSLAWEQWNDPETGKVARRLEYDEDEVPVRELRDKNGNGRFEVIRELRGDELLRTRISSRDDGLMDLVREPLPDGTVREARDANGDGVPECTTILRDGIRLREERDANGDGRPDMWVEFRDGRMVRMETDSDGDGTPDRMRGFP